MSRKSKRRERLANRKAYLDLQANGIRHPVDGHLCLLVDSAGRTIPRDRVLSAFHEAGHALAGTVLSDGIEYTTIERRIRKVIGGMGISDGVTLPKQPKADEKVIEFVLENGLPLLVTETGRIPVPDEYRKNARQKIVHSAISSLAGEVVESVVRPEGCPSGEENDLHEIHAHALIHGIPKDQLRQIVEEAYERCHALLVKPDDAWTTIIAIAEELLQKTKLSGDEVRAIVEAHWPNHQESRELLERELLNLNALEESAA